MSHAKAQAHVIAPAVSVSSAYAPNDVVGDLQVIDLGSVAGAGIMKSVDITDIDNQKAALTILFFRAAPAGIAADNAPAVLSAADAKLVVAKVNIVAADYETIASRAIASVDVSKIIKGGPLVAGDRTGESRRLWVSIVTTGTPTYTTVGSLQVTAGFILDGR